VVCDKQKIPLRVWKREYSLSFIVRLSKTAALLYRTRFPLHLRQVKTKKKFEKKLALVLYMTALFVFGGKSMYFLLFGKLFSIFFAFLLAF